MVNPAQGTADSRPWPHAPREEKFLSVAVPSRRDRHAEVCPRAETSSRGGPAMKYHARGLTSTRGGPIAPCTMMRPGRRHCAHRKGGGCPRRSRRSPSGLGPAWLIRLTDSHRQPHGASEREKLNRNEHQEREEERAPAEGPTCRERHGDRDGDRRHWAAYSLDDVHRGGGEAHPRAPARDARAR